MVPEFFSIGLRNHSLQTLDLRASYLEVFLAPHVPVVLYHPCYTIDDGIIEAHWYLLTEKEVYYHILRQVFSNTYFCNWFRRILTQDVR